nr:DUF4214 domain-containing protein [Acidimicrobiia bacterium]
ARGGDGRLWTAIVFIQGPALAPAPVVSFAPFASASALVNQQYVDLLGRAADAGALSGWSGALQTGQATHASLVAALLASSEHASVVRPVARLYLAYFGRSPDAAGLVYWVGQLRAGNPLTNISNAFASSSEFATRYGSLGNQAFVERVYMNVLGRSPDLAGLTYWLGQLLNGLLNRGGVMTGFSESSEYRYVTSTQLDVASVYLGLLRRAPDAAGLSYWMGQLRAGVPVATFVASILGSAEYRNRF